MTYRSYPDSDRALEELKEFLVSDRKEHILEGGAGTGKSSLIEKLVEEVFYPYQELLKTLNLLYLEKIHLTATTNAACVQLSKTINTTYPVKTIHSLLGIKLAKNYQTGTLDYDTSGCIYIHRSLIIIDEASMIDPRLHKILLNYAVDCKILYVGDWDQLQGVKGTLPNYQFITKSSLSEIKRTSSQELKDLYTDLKQAVHTNIFPKITLSPSIIDWIHDPDEVIKVFLQDPENTSIGAYTNNTVSNINSYLRKELGLSDWYSQGEIVLINNAPRNYSFYPEQRVQILEIRGRSLFDEKGTSPIPIVNCVIAPVGTNLKSSVWIPENLSEYQRQLKEILRKRNFSLFFKLTETLIEVRPRYASTCHKLQGISTITVMLSLTDIFTCRKPNEILRMLYVGASRAKKRIVFFGDVPEKYNDLFIT